MNYINLSNKADEKVSLGRIDEARSLLQKGLSLAKQKGEKSYIEFFLGELVNIKDDYKSGLLHHKKAVGYDPKNPFLLKKLGVTYSLLGKEEEAIKIFDRALEIKPDDYDSLRSKGVSLSKLGKEEEAIKLFDRALEIKPDDCNSLRSKGISLSKLGKEEEAIKLFDRALEIKPDDYDSLRSKGISLSRLGKEEEAIKLFDRPLEIKPDDHNSLKSKGVSLSKLGKEEEAIKLFDRILEIKPDDYNSLKSKGISLSKLGKEEEAIKLFDRALEIKPDDYDSLRSKGISLSKLGKEEEAIKLFDRALEIKPDDWYIHSSKAYTLERINRVKDAKDIFDLLKKNLDKIKEKEIIDLADFKSEILEKKKKEKSSDILNKVINAFQDKQENIFKSIRQIEDGYKTFTDTKRSIPDGFPSFLSVLRKWNSYTPIIPSEKGDNKGGGYFLYHSGKGIVIDPGFNFIENFYQEGFKVADIDAVLITHAHNDHTVDFEPILTLVHKHNDAIGDSVKEELKDKDENEIKHEIEKRIKEQGKKIDVFLNVGTFMKYSGWLNLKDSGEINNVTVLQPDTTYQLLKDYDGIIIHTTKAKHDEIIDNKYAIGFILDIKGIKVGFTGDTGWDWENNGSIAKAFIEHKPKLVIAHLGSIKRREFNYVGAKNEDDINKCFYDNHLGLLGMAKFLDTVKPDLTIISEFGEELKRFRKEIVQGIGEVLKLNCLPGDIGLHIRLSDIGVYCFIENKFINYKKIMVYSIAEDSTLSFHREETDPATFNMALQKKNRMRAIPLSERITDLR